MGGGYYHSDVSSARASIGTVRESSHAFDYSRKTDQSKEKGIHPALNIFNRERECCDSPEHPLTTPIVGIMDVTESRGDDALEIYAQVPSFLGSIKLADLVTDPQVMWMAIGDANSDIAAIQAGQFESDRRIDEDLSRIWMEKGGGGTGQESYELGAYYLAKKTRLDSLKRGVKGFAFFLGDEAPYRVVSPSQVKSLIGDRIKSEIRTEEIFSELAKSYHPFLIFPRSSMEQRRKSIDKEIKQRLLDAGGRFENVDIRATLIWEDRTDLDLHCLTPSGEHIFFASKRARCGGELDVDRNVQGETTKPVENIRWAAGDARRGTYRFWVNLFRYHDPIRGKIPYRVELDINGEIQRFEGSVSSAKEDRKIVEFHYVPHGQRKLTDNHAAYEDAHVLAEWRRYLPEPNILRVQHASNSIEVMLGILALQNGKMDLDGFVRNMKERSVGKDRRDDVAEALAPFARLGVFPGVEAGVF